MPWTNYHSHTKYCDGTDAPAVYAQTAYELGMAAYGFSSHSPVPFESSWAIQPANVPLYIADVNKLKEEYKDKIEIYLSMEVDYIPDMTGVKHPEISSLGLDYTVGSVHFAGAFMDGRPWEIDGTLKVFEEGLEQIYGNDIRKAVTTYFDITRRMLREECPDIVGHIDKIKMHNKAKPFFSEGDSWYHDEVMNTLQEVAKSGAIMEVNTRGIYKKYSDEPYPSGWVLKEAKQLGIPVMINSDSHVPREIIAEFGPTAALLQSCGYNTVRVFLDHTWQDKPLTPQGIIV